ncbi:hypothetical protein Q3C01_01050 [Bradyrhizobium sp. UFLA05-109]
MKKTPKAKSSRLATTRRRNAAKRHREWQAMPEGRLRNDSAVSPFNMNRRILWLAREWQLPAPPKVGRTMSKELASYCLSHNISMNWLISGELLDLQRMLQERKSQQVQAPIVRQIMDKYHRLPPGMQKIIETTVDRLLEQQHMPTG